MSDELGSLREGDWVAGPTGRYQLGERLGAGGFGETFAASLHAGGDVGDDSGVESLVLKFLRLDRLDDFKALELFEREAKVLAALDHPAIPQTRAFFAWDGERAYGHDEVESLPAGKTLRWVMVQSRAAGRSLAQRIAAGERMDSKALASMAKQVLEVLHYLHGLNPPVIHRDIKPGNLMLADDGQVSVVDFGAIQDRARMGASVASTSVGTFGFIPMEQMMGQARPSSDLYALGVTLVVAATHRGPEALPLDEESSKIDLAGLGLNLDPELIHALEGLLEPIAGKRTPSAAQALAQLSGSASRTELTLPATGALDKADDATIAHAALWNASVGIGGLTAGLIYLVFFNSFSETMLIMVSAFWVAPVAFGFFGKLAAKADRPNPIASGLLGAGLTIGALILFMFGIFPSL